MMTVCPGGAEHATAPAIAIITAILCGVLMMSFSPAAERNRLSAGSREHWCRLLSRIRHLPRTLSDRGFVQRGRTQRIRPSRAISLAFGRPCEQCSRRSCGAGWLTVRGQVMHGDDIRDERLPRSLDARARSARHGDCVRQRASRRGDVLLGGRLVRRGPLVPFIDVEVRRHVHGRRFDLFQAVSRRFGLRGRRPELQVLSGVRRQRDVRAYPVTCPPR